MLPNGKEKVIEINSGYAFGTGNHTTTKHCLTILENVFRKIKPERVLDVGCGSGILAIGSVALGAKMAIALDIEPRAVEETKINVRKNGFSSRIKVLCTSIEGIEDRYDLVIANILADDIISISDELYSKLNNDGVLILSGIRDEIKEEISALFKEKELILYYELSDKGWNTFLFKKA